MSNFDYIVVGGGIIGMTTARELAIQGAKVALFDKGELGKESSWAAGGILSSMRPWVESPASVALSEQGKILYPDYVELLKQKTEIDSEYIQSGLVIIDKDHAAKTKEWARDKNVNLEENVQNISCDINFPNHSVLLPDIAQVRPPKLLKALRKSLNSLSVSIYENTKITNLGIKNNQFQFVEFDEGKVVADAVIITAGAWSKSLLGNINKEINIKPIRGQMICVKPEHKILDKIVLDSSHYFIPRRDGHILIGSTMEDVGFVNETTEVAKEELLEWACSICPEINNAQFVRHWSGLRPSTTANIPIIGQISGFKSIYLNTGHFRKGILQAPASAKLLVDNLSGKDSFMDIESFNLECQKKTLELV